MRLLYRIIFTILFFGGIAIIGMVFLTYGHLVAGLSVIIALWKIMRDIYLSRWQIEINGKSVSVVKKYLFSWDKIPGNDNVKLIEFLKKNFGISWVITAKIEKIDDDKTIRLFTDYLLSWDKIPGNDSLRLLYFLEQRFGIEWVKTAKIEKIDNFMTIRVSTETNFLLLKLNNEKTELNIEIDDGTTDKFFVKTENDKLIIYSTENNYISLRLNDEKTKVDLKIDDVRIDEFIVKVENDNLNIYVRNMCVNSRVLYNEICRVQTLWPSIRILIFHLMQRPESEHMISDTSTRLAVPVGAEWSHALRRLLTLSEDLLIQSPSGVTLLVPLATLDGAEKRELWTQLRLKAPPSAFRSDPSLLEKAGMEEEKSNKLLLDRQWKEAFEHFQATSEMWEHAGFMDNTARCLTHMVTCLLRTGRYTDADKLAVQTNHIARNLVDLRKIAHSLNQLAEVQLYIGEKKGLEVALAYLDEARNLYQGLHLSLDECQMLSNQAIIREQLFHITGEYPQLKECQNLAETALDIIQDKLRGNQSMNTRLQEANLKGSLARCEFHIENWDNASKLFERSLNISQSVGRKVNVEDFAMWGRALFKLSQNNSRFRSETDHLQILHQAMKKLDEAVKLAQTHGDFNELVQVYILRGDTFWDMEKLEAAVGDYEVVISLRESPSFAFDGPFDREAFLRRYRKVFTRAVEALILIADRDSKHAYSLVERAFQHCERDRARNLAELLSLSTMMLSKVSDTNLRDRFEFAKKERRAAFLHLKTLQKSEEKLNSKELLQARERLQTAQQIYGQASKEVAELVPEFPDLTSPKVPSLSEVQSWLPSDSSTAVIEFSVGDNGLCVFLVARNIDPVKTCFIIERLGRKAIEARFLSGGYLKEYECYALRRQEKELYERQYFLKWCEWGRSRGSSVQEELKSIRNRIKEMRIDLENLRTNWLKSLPELIETIRNEILLAISTSQGISIHELLNKLNITRLVIIPDGILNRLPIHAAIDDGIEVSYAPSSAVLIQTVAKFTGTPTKALIVANPDDGFTITKYEANLIQGKLLKKGCSILRVEGKNATSQTIIKHMHNCSLFHFCGHAVSNFHSPLESHLEVVCDENSGEDLPTLWETKFLRAKKIMVEGAIQPGAWVVLSACESGASPPDPSGEAVGLPAAFLVAGAATVISTLWAVHAGISLMFMGRFYDNIVEKELSVPIALREATMYLRNLTLDDIERFEDSPELSESEYIVLTHNEAKNFPPHHPVHWAPYVVYGATWSVSEVPSNRLEIGSHQQKLAELSTQIGAGLHPQLGDVLKEAERLFNQKQYLQMVSKLEEALKDYGLSGPLHEGLGNAYAELKNFDKACHHYHEVLRYDPNSSSNHYNLGCVYRDFGHITKARECFQQALHLNPAYANALINLAPLTNDPQEALGYLEQALLIEPGDKDTHEAIRMWQELSREDQVSIALHRLYWAQQELGKGYFPLARQHLALAKNETIDDIAKAMAFSIESDILRKEGDIEGSITALESAVKLNPNQPIYWNTLAARRLLLMDKDNPEIFQSEKLFMLSRPEQEILNAILLGDYARPHQNLAIIYLKRGLLNKAKKHANIACEMAQRQIDTPTEIICNGCPVAICSSGGCESSQNKIICKDCAIEGKMPTECQECLRKALGILRDIELASGDYKVE